jgi:hypothetical protein
MKAEVYEAFRAIDVPEDKALRAAEALSKRDEDVADLKGSVRLLQWMVTTSIGLTVLLLGSVLALWAKLGDIGGQVAQIARSTH